LLDAVQSYFTYELHTRCSIPAITLEGTADDWQALADRVVGFADLGREPWVETLLSLLRPFVAAARGDVDPTFWRSIYKLTNQSGGPIVTGWVTAFFPYLNDSRTGLASQKNPWVWGETTQRRLQGILYPDAKAKGYQDGPTSDAFPSGLAKAPFLWNYLETDFEMEFLGGFVGMTQESKTFCLRPEVGWVVREAPPSV